MTINQKIERLKQRYHNEIVKAIELSRAVPWPKEGKAEPFDPELEKFLDSFRQDE